MKRLVASIGCAIAIIAIAQPATARRTLVDMPSIVTGGYCAPNDTAACAPRNLGFTVRIGSTDYSQFVVNGNGTLSLGAGVNFSLATGTLSDYGIPVFTPLINNYVFSESNRTFYSSLAAAQPIPPSFLDTVYVGRLLSQTANSISLIWFQCDGWTNCGPDSRNYDRPFTLLDPPNPTAAQVQNVFGLTLTKLGDGFQVDYLYNQPRGRPAPGESSTVDPYGFYLPGGSSLQTIGAFENRSFRFDANGQLVPGGVPEPSAWLLMIIGFGAIAGILRRRTRRLAIA